VVVHTVHDGGGSGSYINVAAISQVLQELRIDLGTIEAITKLLGDGVDEADFEPSQVPANRFGTLPGGSSLGQHTELARRVVTDALATMVSDLQLYTDGVETFRKGVNVADQHASADVQHIQAQLSSVRSDSTEGWDK
jgi:hypothetical protein